MWRIVCVLLLVGSLPVTVAFLDGLRDAVSTIFGGNDGARPSATAVQEVLMGDGPISGLLRNAASYAEAVRQYRYPIEGVNNVTLPFRWVEGDPEGPARAFAAYDASYQHIILAFASDESVAASSNGDDSSQNGEFNVTQSFLRGVQANGIALRDFWSLYTGANVTDDAVGGIEGVLGDLLPPEGDPLRVTCTGEGPGGSAAQLCALWAGMQYPFAQVDLFSFNAQWAGVNAQFNWTIAQLAQHLYALPYTAANFTTGRLQPAPAADTLLLATIVQVEVPDGAPDLPSGLPSSPRDPRFEGPTDTSIGDILGAVTETIRSRNSDEASPFQPLSPMAVTMYEIESRCEPVLCRALLGARLSCDIYTPEGAANRSLEATPLFQVYENSVPVRSSRSTIDSGVVWFPDSSIAAFVFQGTQTNEDWLSNSQLVLTNDFASTALPDAYDEAFPDVRVHDGFWEQFASVTYQAPSRDESLDGQLDRLTQGQTPQRILCTGHSLGAGLADLCAVWAAFRYPNASITVTTLGTPMPGNRAFMQLLLAVVGRTYRVIHGLDLVPALPPIDSYAAAASAMWLSEGQLLLQARPLNFQLRDLDWEDHSCNAYAELLFDANFTTPPDYIAMVV